MTVEKSQLRAAAFLETGNLLDDRLESAAAAVHIARGEKSGIVLAGRAVEGLVKAVDGEVEAGHLDLTQADLAKKWLVRVGGALQNLALGADARIAQAMGAEAALRGAVALVKARFDAEEAKGRSLAEDPAGGHPGPTVKQLRQQDIPQPDPEPAKAKPRKKPPRKR